MTKQKDDVFVTRNGKVISSFTTIRRAERFIADIATRHSKEVARGDYGIDASERADAAYQRLKHTVGRCPSDRSWPAQTIRNSGR